MANYIDKEIVCEMYVHIKFSDYSNEKKLNEIKSRVKNYFDERVSFLLGDSVETLIETEEGSLKLKVSALAGIAALVGSAIMKYPDFRDAIKIIHEDSKVLAEATALETIFVTKTPSCDRIHSEARTGVIGRTAKIITTLESLADQSRSLKAPATKADIKTISELNGKLSAVFGDIEKLLNKINTDEDRYCIAKGFYMAYQQLPSVLPAENELNNSQIKRSLINGDDLRVKMEFEFQRYISNVNSAKAVIKRIGAASKPKQV
ncbi:hypothetical protein [Paracidovorax avenae]|uniref:hypothetical protein n=1 Tax=Paracidovorax avenae TaxID=80867 RepID=UPI001313E9B1|nr:hypothetical protein [Paracidovorax avenae]